MSSSKSTRPNPSQQTGHHDAVEQSQSQDMLYRHSIRLLQWMLDHPVELHSIIHSKSLYAQSPCLCVRIPKDDLRAAGLDPLTDMPSLATAIAYLSLAIEEIAAEQSPLRIDHAHCHYHSDKESLLIPFPQLRHANAFSDLMLNHAPQVREALRTRIYGTALSKDDLPESHRPPVSPANRVSNALIDRQMQMDRANILQDCLSILSHAKNVPITPINDGYGLMVRTDWPLHTQDNGLSVSHAFKRGIAAMLESHPALMQVQTGIQPRHDSVSQPMRIGFIAPTQAIAQQFKQSLELIADKLRHQLGFSGVSTGYVIQ